MKRKLFELLIVAVSLFTFWYCVFGGYLYLTIIASMLNYLFLLISIPLVKVLVKE